MRSKFANISLIRPTLFVVALTLLPLGVDGQTTTAQAPGALISMTLKGTVGVLLDEIPPGQWREKAAQ